MKTKLLFLTIALTILSSCGGDSNSGVGPDVVLFENDGVYADSQTIIFYGSDGELLGSDEFGFNMSVFEDDVAISDAAFLAEAPISDGIFIASSGVFVESNDEITCDVTFTYNGTIGLGTAQGTIQGNYVCRLINGLGNLVSFPIDGDFQSSRSAVASKITLINETQLKLSGIAEIVRNAL